MSRTRFLLRFGLSGAALWPAFVISCHAAEPLAFRGVRLTDAFYCEGAAVGDFDRDGHADVLSGPFLYLGPDFVTRREVFTPVPCDPHGYSQNFLSFAADLNGDGWDDVVQVGWPGQETVWYANPAGKRSPLDGNTLGHWDRHVGFAVTDNESPGWDDLTGDGKPELILQTDGQYGYASPNLADPTNPWVFHAVSDKTDRGRYTHGLGVGDINGDGRPDLLEKDGWWEHPESPDAPGPWPFHSVKFAENGAQILAADVNGDGRADVISAENAHGYGINWFEQQPDGSFAKHIIMGPRGGENPLPICFSQPHALALADMNGDGLPDFVTGKRFWAHGPGGDAEPQAPPVIYAFLLKRDGGESRFEPLLIDDASGVGTQVTVADLNADGKPDIVVGNKLGTFVHWQK